MEGTYHAPETIAFTLDPGPIEYFKMEQEMFTEKPNPKSYKAGTIDPVFDVEVLLISLGPDEYLEAGSGKKMAVLNPESRDTAVLNFQVGKGKTTLLFHYIDYYINHAQGDYLVLYCAPFLRLIDEIKAGLKARTNVECVVCTEIDARTPSMALESNAKVRVQLMTPEFLLGSGGKKYVQQQLAKRDYKMDLRDALRNSERKAVLFLDELHENTAVFDSHNLPNLLQWGVGDLIHKVFIASATFTRSSVEVIKTVSYLTEQKIRIYQADRTKSPSQAKLHLHICNPGTDRAAYAKYLPGLARVAQESFKDGRVVHILTAHRKVAEALVSGEFAAAKAVKQLKPELLTNGTRRPFNASKSSVGTTFTTGVNINDPRAVLILVLPPVMARQGELSNGIFTGMLTALVQAFARLREGGDVHVFIPAFSKFIETRSASAICDCRALLTKAGSDSPESVGHIKETALWLRFKKLHQERQEQHETVLNTFQNPQAKNAYEHGVGFQKLYDFTLAEYPDFVDAALHQDGQGLGPYVLWLAVKDQLANCTLSSISVESFTSATQFTSSVPSATLERNFWEQVQRRRKEAQNQKPSSVAAPASLHEAVEQVLNYLDLHDDGASSRHYNWGRVNAEGNIRKGFEADKNIAKSVFECALKLYGKQLKKREMMPELLTTARSSAPFNSYEGRFNKVKQQVDMLAKHLVGEAPKSPDGQSVYFKSPFLLNITGSVKAEKARAGVADSLKALHESHPLLLHTGIVDFPGASKGLPAEVPALNKKLEEVSENLVAQRLNLVGSNNGLVSKGSPTAFGVGKPCFTKKLSELGL